MGKRTDEPSIKLAGLSIWITGRQFEDAQDYWDGNWLNVSAEVEAHQARIKTQGSILRIDELASFHDELVTLYSKLTGTASLEPLEPELKIFVKALPRGVVMVEVQITPDHMTQFHRIEFEIDQSYLPKTISELALIISAFPLRGSSN